MLKLLLGRAGTGKTRALLEAMAAGDGRPQILIVPEQHSHSMERQLCAIGGSRVSLFAEVLSFTRLANRVFSVYGGLAAPALDGGGRLLLLCAALKSVAIEQFPGSKNYLFDYLPEDLQKHLQDVRMGNAEFGSHQKKQEE